MRDGLRYHADLARWELRLAPETAWVDPESPAPGVTIHRTVDGEVAAVAVDADHGGGMPAEARSAVLEATGIDLVADHAGSGSRPAQPGHLAVGDDETTFAVSPSSPTSVDRGRPGRWTFDDERLTAHIAVPIEPGTSPSDLWVSVVEMGTGQVLAAGSLSSMVDGEASTTLTIGVPFVAGDVRVDVGRLAPVPEPMTPARWVWAVLAGVVALVAATIAAGVTVWTEPGVESAGDLVFVAQIAGMAAELVVSVLLVERLWRFSSLRPLVGFVGVAAVWAYSNILYSMLNLGMGWGSWYASVAENLQWSTIVLLPVAAAWAFVGLVGRVPR